MTIRRTALALLLASAAGSAMAQQSITPPESSTPQQSASPYDTNPACRERTADSNSPECMVQQEGQPRQTYPQKVKPTPPPTQPPPTTPASPPLTAPRQNSGSGLR